MDRLGTLLVFKEGTTKAEAAMALNQIRGFLDLPAGMVEAAPHVRQALERGETVRFTPNDWVEVPFKIISMVEEYDADYGHPVWYIP